MIVSRRWKNCLQKKEKKNFRNVYIIDSENTFNIALLPIKEINEMDKVVIFMSQNSKTVKPKVLQEIINLKCEVEVEFVEVGGANALDFQLVVYLTKSCLENCTAKHFVLSNDKGFNKAINYINKNKIGVVRLIEEPKTTNKTANSEKNKKKQKKKKAAKENEKIKALISPINLKESDLNFLRNQFSKQTDLRNFHNKLVQHFGVEGIEIYKKCRDSFRNR